MCDFCQYSHKTEEHGDFVKSLDPNIPNLEGKPKYKDAPRFPMIYEYEGQFKDNYKKTVQAMSKALAIKMSSYAK